MSVIRACIDRFRSDAPTSPHHRKAFVTEDAFWWLKESDYRRHNIEEGKSGVISNKFKNRIKGRERDFNRRSKVQQKYEVCYDHFDPNNNEERSKEENDDEDEVESEVGELLNITSLKSITSVLNGKYNARANYQKSIGGCSSEINSSNDSDSESDSDSTNDVLKSEFYRRLLRQLRNSSSSSDNSKRIVSKYKSASNKSISSSSLNLPTTTHSKLSKLLDNKPSSSSGIRLINDRVGIRVRSRVPRTMKHVRVNLPVTTSPSVSSSNHTCTSSCNEMAVGRESTATVSQPISDALTSTSLKEKEAVSSTSPSLSAAISIHETILNHESELLVDTKLTPMESNTSIIQTTQTLSAGEDISLYLSGSDSDNAQGTGGTSNFVKRRVCKVVVGTTESELRRGVAVEVTIDTVEPYLYDPVVAELWESLVAVRQCIGDLRRIT